MASITFPTLAGLTDALSGKYSKPGSGIPTADLASATQALLALVPRADIKRFFDERAQRNTPQFQGTYWDKANTAAGVVPGFDVGGIPLTAFDNGAAGAALRVLNGGLTFTPTAAGPAAGYAAGDVGAPTSGGGLRWKWNKTGRTTEGSSICLALTRTKMSALAAPYPDAALHLVVSPYQVQLQYITGGAGATFGNIWTPPAGNNELLFASALAQDNLTEHEMQVFINGNALRVVFPDGRVLGPFIHPALVDNIGSGFYIECYATNGNTDSIPIITDAWMMTGAVKAPSQLALTRKTFDQLAAWEPTLFGTPMGIARAVGPASVAEYITTNRTVGAVGYLLGTADASGATTVELRSDGVTIPGTAATIPAGQVIGQAVGPFTFITGKRITIHITAVGGTPGQGINAKMIRS